MLNKLNHISLFFISAILSYIVINYILRVILTLPFKNNIYNQYKATSNSKDPSTYTAYNVLLEKACYLAINRYNLTLPSGVMLYTYLSAFQIGDNTTKYTDCITTIFGPFLSILILWLSGYLLYLFEDNDFEKPIKMFPIIGLNDNENEYFTCQANYILPRELNMGLLIHDCIDKYNFEENIYKKVEKALFRISKELLTKYNPLFQKEDFKNNKNSIFDNLKFNKIYIDILKLLKKNNFIEPFNNLEYYDKIKTIIKNENIPYKNKYDMYELLEHINNTLIIKKEINTQYENDTLLARNELYYDKEITDIEIKKKLKDILNTYINNFRKNLGLPEIPKNRIDNNYLENNDVNNKNFGKENVTLYGYHYNIVTYSLFNDSFFKDRVRIISNKLFKILLRLISTWLLFAKPIGSAWLIVKYILISNSGFEKLLGNLNSKFFIWKYFTMGFDKLDLEESYKKYQNNHINNNKNSIVKKGLNFFYTILIFIFILPLLYMYNSITFGFTLSPLWYNLLYQCLFIINIIGNIICHFMHKSHLTFNIIFIIVFIVIMILISVISYFIESKK